MISIEIKKLLISLGLPVLSPLLQIISRQLLKNQAADNQILQRFSIAVGRDQIVGPVQPGELYLLFQLFTSPEYLYFNLLSRGM